jgi:hypothetical protein
MKKKKKFSLLRQGIEPWTVGIYDPCATICATGAVTVCDDNDYAHLPLRCRFIVIDKKKKNFIIDIMKSSMSRVETTPLDDNALLSSYIMAIAQSIKQCPIISFLSIS